MSSIAECFNPSRPSGKIIITVIAVCLVIFGIGGSLIGSTYFPECDECPDCPPLQISNLASYRVTFDITNLTIVNTTGDSFNAWEMGLSIDSATILTFNSTLDELIDQVDEYGMVIDQYTELSITPANPEANDPNTFYERISVTYMFYNDSMVDCMSFLSQLSFDDMLKYDTSFSNPYIEIGMPTNDILFHAGENIVYIDMLNAQTGKAFLRINDIFCITNF